MEKIKSKILIVDDDATIRLKLEKFLESKGYIVAALESPVLAAEFALHEEFDVIITDINMPEVNGYEFVLWLKKNNINSKIIVMTSYFSNDSREKFNEHKILEYIEKPLDLEKLYDIIKHSEENQFKGKVTEINIFDFVQMLLFSKKNKLVFLHSDISTVDGKIFIKNGEVIHAQYNGTEGVEAFYKIMSIQKGSFKDEFYEEPEKTTINLPANVLLIEAAKKIDDLSSQEIVSPKDERIKFLVVDDDETSLAILKNLLSKQNYYVDIEKSPIRASLLLLEKKYDFLISDINMPEVNGFQLLSLVKQSQLTLKVIMITAFGSDYVRDTALKNGAVKYLEKPIKAEELLPIIESGIKGDVKEITLLDFIQIVLNSRQNKVIKVLSTITKKEGKIFIKEGKVVHAEYEKTKGKEAFFKMLLLEKGLFSEQKWEEPLEVSLEQSSTTLLLQAIQFLDEEAVKDKNPKIEQKEVANIEDKIAKLQKATKKEANDKKIITETKSIKKDNNLEKKGGNLIIMSDLANLDKVVEIAEDTYWVSQRNPNTLLQLNSYLRVFKGGGRSVNLLVDPGAIEYFPVISRKAGQVMGDMSKLHMYSINHQDPDVGMNSTFISRMNPKSVCLCTEDTWRLVQFFEIPKNSYKNVYAFENKRVNITTSPDHIIEFVPTPYCHFVGAFALYDKKNRVLFTGDLFGGLNPANNMSLIATEDHWEGMKTFHQIYMPSNKAIRNAIDNIRALPVQPLMIVPQHGAVLTGEIMEQFMNRLYNLEVGIDLLDKVDQEKLNPMYIQLINLLYEKFVSYVGLEEAKKLFKFEDKNQELYHFVEMNEKGITSIFSQPENSLNVFLKVIGRYHQASVINEIKSLAIKETLFMRLPMPINIYNEISMASNDSMESPFESTSMDHKEEELFV